MIFLFFGTSLALLEAELAPFKDWDSQMLPISSQSFNAAKSASRRATEGFKKRKIIRI